MISATSQLARRGLKMTSLVTYRDFDRDPEAVETKVTSDKNLQPNRLTNSYYDWHYFATQQTFNISYIETKIYFNIGLAVCCTCSDVCLASFG